jgi:hypothetical protein
MGNATNEETRERVDSYVSDMLALEKHIATALAGQIEDLDEHSATKGALVRIHAVCERHVRDLEALTSTREQNVGGVSKAVKGAVSSVLGFGAAAIDFVRTEKLPKNLRDDYAALSLAYVGDLMLHSTALSVSDAETASLARSHMSDHATSIDSLRHVIPAATIGFLASEGLDVDFAALPAIERTLSETRH